MQLFGAIVTYFGELDNKSEIVYQVFHSKLKSIQQLTIDFDYKKLIGDDRFKLAMNIFTYDESHLASMQETYGDFFFIFDQLRTWIPPFPYSLPDIEIMGKTFTLRYDDIQNGKFR